MKQPIPGRQDVLANNQFGPVMGLGACNATENLIYELVPTGGTLSNLLVSLTAAPGAGTSWTITLVVDGTPSTLTVTIADASTTGSDIVHSVNVSAGQTVSYKITSSGAPSAASSLTCVDFTGTTANESILIGNAAFSTSNSRYANICGLSTVPLSTESSVSAVVPTSGTLKNLYLKLSADPGTSPDAYSLTLVYDGSPSSIVASITADNTTGNDTAHTQAIATGHKISFLKNALNTPSASPRGAYGIVFVADTDGESLLIVPAYNQSLATGDAFSSLGGGATWNATIANRTMILSGCSLKNLFIGMVTAPGGATSRTFTLDKGGATTLTQTISGAATSGNDTIHTVSVTSGDSLAISEATSGAAASTTGVTIALVAYTASVSGWAHKYYGQTISKFCGSTFSKINGL